MVNSLDCSAGAAQQEIVHKNYTCQIVSGLTVWPDLPAGAWGGHALLAGALVGAVLQPDDGLARLHRLLVELPLVGRRLLRPQRRHSFLMRLVFRKQNIARIANAVQVTI